MPRLRLTAMFVALVAALLCSGASALTLIPGSILGADSVGQAGSTFTLVQYSPSGTILDSLPLGTLTDFGTMDGVAVIGSDVFVVGTGGMVAEVDLTNGDLTTAFSTISGSEALGELNGNLIVGMPSPNRIDVYTPAGAFINSIIPSVEVGMTGIDSNGSQIFAASFNDGNVYTLDLTGNVISSFDTGAGSASLSGLGYDAGSNTLWVSTGFDQDDIRQYDLAGNLLGSFAAGYPFIDGLAVVPIPEPGSLILAGLVLAGSLPIFSRGRRCRS